MTCYRHASVVEETNGLFLPPYNFILEMFPQCTVLEKNFHINKLLVSPALLVNTFLSPPKDVSI